MSVLNCTALTETNNTMHIRSIAKVSRSLYRSLKFVGEHLEHVDLHGPSPAGGKISTEPGAAFCLSPSTT